MMRLREKMSFLIVAVVAVLALTASRTVFPFSSLHAMSEHRGSEDPFRSQAQGDRLPKPSRRQVVKIHVDPKGDLERSGSLPPAFLAGPNAPEGVVGLRDCAAPDVIPRGAEPFLRATPQSALSPPL